MYYVFHVINATYINFITTILLLLLLLYISVSETQDIDPHTVET